MFLILSPTLKNGYPGNYCFYKQLDNTKELFRNVLRNGSDESGGGN